MSEEKANIGTPKPKLLIVDDDKHILEAFTLLFEDEYEVKTCQNLKEAVDHVTNDEFDVILLDVELGPDKGLDLLPVIDNMQNKPEVIMISGHEKSHYIVPSMRFGVRDYLVKPIDKDLLRKEVRKALLHKNETLLYEGIKLNRKSAEKLTHRELKIIKLLYEGNKRVDIARMLNLKDATVRSIVHRVLRKLGVKHAQEAFKIILLNN